jgi:hypothetical protein
MSEEPKREYDKYVLLVPRDLMCVEKRVILTPFNEKTEMYLVFKRRVGDGTPCILERPSIWDPIVIEREGES